MRNEGSGGAEERRKVETARAFNQFRAKQLELLRMDSQDSEKITEHANNNQEPLNPKVPFNPSSDSISTPRSSNRPPVPLSTFERLPTEIHVAVVEELIRGKVDSLSYTSACRLARASPVFTRIVQKRLYLEIVLEGNEQARKWLESGSTIRGEFATRALSLRGEEGQLMDAGVVEKVLVSQTSALKELGLIHVESVKSSRLNALTSQSLVVSRVGEADEILVDLRLLHLEACEVKMYDDSAAKPVFQLHTLNIGKSTLSSSYLRDIMISSSFSLRRLQVIALDTFDWTPVTSASFAQLQVLRLRGPHVPPLIHLLSACENLTTLAILRTKQNSAIAISDSTNRISHLSKELASLPGPTLKTCRLNLNCVGRSGGDITLQEVEDLIALPSLANMDRLLLYVPRSWVVSDIEALRRNKGKTGKLVVAAKTPCEFF